MTYYQQERRARHRNEKGQKWGMIAGFLGSFLKGLIDQRSEAADKEEQRRQHRNRMRLEQESIDSSTEDRRLRLAEMRRANEEAEEIKRNTLEQRQSEAKERAESEAADRTLRQRDIDLKERAELRQAEEVKATTKKAGTEAARKAYEYEKDYQLKKRKMELDERESVAGPKGNLPAHTAQAIGAQALRKDWDLPRWQQEFERLEKLRDNFDPMDPESAMTFNDLNKQIQAYERTVGNLIQQGRLKETGAGPAPKASPGASRGGMDFLRRMFSATQPQMQQQPAPMQQPQTGQAQPLNPINGTPPTSPANFQSLAASFNKFIRGGVENLQNFDYLAAIGQIQQAFPQTMQFAPPSVQEAVVPYMVGGVDGIGSSVPGLQPGFGQLLTPNPKQHPQGTGPYPLPRR